MKASVFSFLALFILVLQLPAQTQSKVPQDYCLSQQEYRMYMLINNYRSKLALDAIPLSRSLSYVAKTHAKDLDANFSTGDDCNMHSWSDKGTWKPFCFPADQNRKNDVKDKAKELSNYPGKAWEITYWDNVDTNIESILGFWNSIEYTADMISNTGDWAKKEWKSIGVGIHNGYVLVWFGVVADVEISTSICETGEKIQNKAIPHELKVKEGAKPLAKGSHFIIIGSFKKMSDAKSAVDSYHQMGYSNAQVVESQGRIRVAIDVFSKEQEASDSLKKYREKFQGAWVLSQK